jgi:putative nucleotidyltransferase with HDIG domain
LEQSDFIQRFRRSSAFSMTIGAVVACLVVGFIVFGVLKGEFARTVQAGLVNLASTALKQGVTTDNTAGVKQISETVGTLIKANSYVQVVIVDPDGNNVFSASVDGPGAVVAPSRKDISAALKGQSTTRIVKVGGHDTVQVIAPLKGPAGTPPPGVLSGSRPLELFLTGAIQTIAALTITILASAAFAYAMVWQFTRRAALEIARHEQESSALQSRLGDSLRDIEQQAIGTLQALSTAVDAKDSYTALHSVHVADYACDIARQLGREDLVPHLERAGLLHDIGKIGVPENILQKPSALSKAEFSLAAEHSRLGANIIETIPFLGEIVPTVLHHHERWDGTGYPDGLEGLETPLEARILAVADAFDAMTTLRPYQAEMPPARAVEELRRGRGGQFDPILVDEFIAALVARGDEAGLRKAAS